MGARLEALRVGAKEQVELVAQCGYVFAVFRQVVESQLSWMIDAKAELGGALDDRVLPGAEMFVVARGGQPLESNSEELAGDEVWGGRDELMATNRGSEQNTGDVEAECDIGGCAVSRSAEAHRRRKPGMDIRQERLDRSGRSALSIVEEEDGAGRGE